MNKEQVDKLLKRPPDLIYHGDLDLFNTWSLGPVIEHRDSTQHEKSIARVTKQKLEKLNKFSDCWSITTCNHWAVGWVDHLSFKVYENDGSVCEIVEWVLQKFFSSKNENDTF
jgi:hypothetical protein